MSYQRGVERAEEAVESPGRTVRLLIRVTQPLQCGDTEDELTTSKISVILKKNKSIKKGSKQTGKPLNQNRREIWIT